MKINTRGKNITIIGGSGGMGQVFGKYFKKHGYNVTLYARNENNLREVAEKLDVKYEVELKSSVINADIVMISVPIHSTEEMIKKVAPLMKQDSLLFDITSIKEPICRLLSTMSEKYPINCLSLHPMFGPGISNMKNLIIILAFIVFNTTTAFYIPKGTMHGPVIWKKFEL